MADDIARLQIQVDTSEVKKGEKALERLADEASRADKEAKQLAKSSKIAGKAIGAGIGVAVGLVARDILNVNQEFESLRASLVTVTGDIDKAGIAFDGLQEFASKTPFAVTELTQAFIKLGSLGLAPTERALRSYGNTAGALSKSLSQVAEAVADATVGEFERLKEFGIKARSEGENVAFTFAGVTTTVKKNADEIQEYLINLGETEFAGGMERQAATLSGAFSNLGDSWDKLLDTLLDESLSAKLAGWVRAIGGAFDSLTDLIDGDTPLEVLSNDLDLAQKRLTYLLEQRDLPKAFRDYFDSIEDVDIKIDDQQKVVADLAVKHRALALEVYKGSKAFDELTEGMSKTADAAPEISKELKKALADVQKEAKKTAAEFQDLYNDLVAPEIDGPVTSIDVNNLQLEADSALRSGDFDGAIAKAKKAFELLEQMKDEGNAASFELEYYGEQLKRIGEEAGTGKIDQVELTINQSLAQQSAMDANTMMQAHLDANPLVQIATIEWAGTNPGTTQSVESTVQSSSENSAQQSYQPVVVNLPGGRTGTINSGDSESASIIREFQLESNKRGKR